MLMWLAQYKNVSQFTVSTAHPNEAFGVSVNDYTWPDPLTWIITCVAKTGRIKLLRCLGPFNYITGKQLPLPLMQESDLPPSLVGSAPRKLCGFLQDQTIPITKASTFQARDVSEPCYWL